MATLKKKGLDNILNKIQGEPTVTDIMSDSFIRKHTGFGSWKEFVESSGIESPEDVESGKFTQFISENSEFKNWRKMYDAAFFEFLSNMKPI